MVSMVLQYTIINFKFYFPNFDFNFRMFNNNNCYLKNYLLRFF